MEPTVTVLFGLLEAALLALQNALAERTFNTGRVLDELIDWQLVRLGYDFESIGHAQSDSA
jgi:hypothetical protein